jgi:hypothetical protein
VSVPPASQQAFFSALIQQFNDCGIPFMISGSLASSVHGQPRATNDLDLVIDPSSDALERFLARTPPQWYVSTEAARDALARRSIFNVIDVEGGWKADLIIRKDRPFSVEEFRRRIRAQVLGVDVAMVSPEDSILSKLEWSAESGSQRQFADALAVAQMRGEDLDRGYLMRWAAALGVTQTLQRLFNEIEDVERKRTL